MFKSTFYYLLFLILFLLSGCSDSSEPKDIVDLEQTSNISSTELQSENLLKIKDVTKSIAFSISGETDFEKLKNVINKNKSYISKNLYTEKLNTQSDKFISNFSTDYGVLDVQILNTSYDSLSNKDILDIVYVLKVNKDYSEFYDNPVFSEELEVHKFSYSISKNIITNYTIFK